MKSIFIGSLSSLNCACFLLVAGFFSVANLSVSSTSFASDEVARKLLKDYWSHTRAQETDEFYKGVATKNANAIYAYALVKSRQHDIKSALAAIEELHKLDDKNPQPWRLKTWLLLRHDKFNQAAVNLEKYIAAVAKEKQWCSEEPEIGSDR